MKKFGLFLLAPIAGFVMSATVAHANDLLSTAERIAAAKTPLVSTDISAQRGNGRRGGGAMGGGNRGGGARGGGGMRGGGRVGGANVGRVGGGMRGGNVGRTGRVGGNYGRTGRVGYVGRTGGRVGWNSGRGGRYGLYYGRYGRYGGRIGYVPPVVVPLPPGPGLAPGPGIVAPSGPTCAVCPVQQCQVAVYGEQGLQGQSVETRDNQPRLDSNGWQNQISSIIVKGGTWEFYPDLEYRGAPPLRLSPGSYPVLEQQWTKSIGSFLCIK